MVTKLQYGINLNSDPRAPTVRPANPAELNGLKWARMAFKFHDIFQQFGYELGNFNNYDEPLKKAFQAYDPLIAGYKQVGVQTLLVLDQESFSGNAPWFPGPKVDWDAEAADQFATDFANFCGQIAAHYKGQGIAYEIWNEGDVKPENQNPEQPTSVYVKAQYFAPILKHASDTIKAKDPNALVISGGLATGAGEAVQYLTAIKNQLGELPVDAIAIHPYCQYVGPNPPNIPGLWSGKIDNTLNTYIQAFPNQKFWITEMGVSDTQPIPQEFWPGIATYMEDMCNRIQDKYSDHVQTLVWFAWSDQMRNAGIVDTQGNRKQPIYNRLFTLAQSTVSEPVHQQIQPEAPQAALLTLALGVTSLNLRDGEGTQFTKIDTIVPEDKLIIIEPDVQAALAKLGQDGKWIHVRTPRGIDGFAAAWFLTRVIDLDSIVFPTEDSTGRTRALGFNHTPTFVRLPVFCDPTDVHWFNGFGPNNYAYNDFRTHTGTGVYYRNTFGLHNGLDFGVPFGTPLCAVDWGRVVQVSTHIGDAPFGAAPFTVAIRYGRYIAIYGHMSGLMPQNPVSVGDIVAPGQQIGLSGQDVPPAGITPTPHLHFELRELDIKYAKTLAAQAQGADDVLQKMDDLFNLGTAAGKFVSYYNPALFFTTHLATYNWPSGQHLANVDHDNNGYPDQVVLAGHSIPTANDIESYQSFPLRRAGSYWAGSHEV